MKAIVKLNFTIHRDGIQNGGSYVDVTTVKPRIFVDAGLPLEDWSDDGRTPAETHVFPAAFAKTARKWKSIADLIL